MRMCATLVCLPLEQDPAQKQEVALGETIIYTYDVSWKESPTHWASRWDIYLTMNHAVKNRVSDFLAVFIVGRGVLLTPAAR